MSPFDVIWRGIFAYDKIYITIKEGDDSMKIYLETEKREWNFMKYEMEKKLLEAFGQIIGNFPYISKG